MKDFLLYASVLALFVVCILVVLVILMQRPSANAGMGSALGGGAAESVLGGGAADWMSKFTTILTVLLFILSFGLYLGFLARNTKTKSALDVTATADSKAPVNKAEPVKATAAVPTNTAVPATTASTANPVATPGAKPAATPAAVPTTVPANKAEPVKPVAPAGAK